MKTNTCILAVALISALFLGACVKDEERPTGPKMGTISFDSVTQTSFHVGWSAATTDVTDPLLIQYKAVYSTGDNISTMSDAETNGTVITNWATNTFGATIYGLSAYTKYYIAVLAKDVNGDKSIVTGSLTTLCDGKVMFLANVPNGAFGGAAGADTACNAQKPAGLGAKTFKAMIAEGTTRAACYSAGFDDCTALGTTGRADWVFTANQKYCTSDYASLVGTTDNNALLLTAGPNILSSSGTSTFTGFGYRWGSSLGLNCSAWTTADPTYQAIVGTANGVYDASKFTLLQSGVYPYCNEPGTLICVEQ